MNQGFRDLLAEFNAHRVEYIVVGWHALAAHGYVRATKDFDVWVRPSADNAPRVLAALAASGHHFTTYVSRSGIARHGFPDWCSAHTH